jgi:hypothetical protein
VQTRNERIKLNWFLNLQSNTFMIIRVRVPIHNRRSYGSSITKLIYWHHPTRYFPCGDPLPLCPINRRCISNHSRAYLMTSTIYRAWNPKWLKVQFTVIFIGVNIIVFPQHFLGLVRIPRWYSDYLVAYTLWNSVSTIGFLRALLLSSS